MSVIDDDEIGLSGKNEDDSVDDADFPCSSCRDTEIKEVSSDGRNRCNKNGVGKVSPLINLVSLAPAYTRCGHQLGFRVEAGVGTPGALAIALLWSFNFNFICPPVSSHGVKNKAMLAEILIHMTYFQSRSMFFLRSRGRRWFAETPTGYTVWVELSIAVSIRSPQAKAQTNVHGPHSSYSTASAFGSITLNMMEAVNACTADPMLRSRDLTFKQDNRSYHARTQPDSCFDDCIRETDVPLHQQKRLEAID